MDDVTDSPEPSEPRDEMELAHEWGEVAEVEHDIAWNEDLQDLHDDLLGDFDDDGDFDEPASESYVGPSRADERATWLARNGPTTFVTFSTTPSTRPPRPGVHPPPPNALGPVLRAHRGMPDVGPAREETGLQRKRDSCPFTGTSSSSSSSHSQRVATRNAPEGALPTTKPTSPKP
jgi:hypothetical protein